jgi:hypothetical protein
MTVTGKREDDDHKVTLGEVYRLVLKVAEEHGDKLDAIEQQVRITNGRTTKLETQMETINRERDVKVLPMVVPEGESLSIKISPKMWALIASAFMGMSMFAPVLQRWLTKLVDGQ